MTYMYYIYHRLYLTHLTLDRTVAQNGDLTASVDSSSSTSVSSTFFSVFSIVYFLSLISPRSGRSSMKSYVAIVSSDYTGLYLPLDVNNLALTSVLLVRYVSSPNWCPSIYRLPFISCSTTELLPGWTFGRA